MYNFEGRDLVCIHNLYSTSFVKKNFVRFLDAFLDMCAGDVLVCICIRFARTYPDDFHERKGQQHWPKYLGKYAKNAGHQTWRKQTLTLRHVSDVRQSLCSTVFVSETFHTLQFLCLNLPKILGVPDLKRLSCSGAPQQLEINHARHPIFCPCFLALLAQVTMARKKQDSLKAIP